ncbi:MAG: hypothetical protein GY839_00340 [candidate division Zixibacteria bacterium]|nr:hypothetical protein [candidate division Zixibacteria bacterium]
MCTRKKQSSGKISEFKVRNIVIMLVLALFVPQIYPTASAEKILSRIKRKMLLSGELSAEIQYDDVTGADQNRPRWVQSLHLTSGLGLLGIPLGKINLNFSSFDTDFRRPFNGLNIHLSRNWAEAYLGDSNPKYSKYTLNGIHVRGGSVDLKPGHVNLAFTLGRIQKANRANDSNEPDFKQYLYGMNIGVGTTGNSQVHLSLVKINDYPNPDSSTASLNQAENLVAGLDGVLHLFKSKLKLKGELAGSAFSRDITSPAVEISEDVRGIATNLFKPRISSQYDLAFYLDSEFRLSNGKFKLYLVNVGPDFNSLGVPDIHSDERKFGGILDQALLTKKIRFKTGLDLAHDNLSDLKRSTMTNFSGLLNTSFVFIKYPIVTFGYRFKTQADDNDDDDSLNVDNINQTLNLGLSQQYGIMNLRGNYSLNYSLGWFRDNSPLANPGIDYDFHSLNALGNTRLNIPVILHLGFGWSQNIYDNNGGDDRRWRYKLGVTYKPMVSRFSTTAYIDYDLGKLNDSQNHSRTRRWSYSIRSEYRINNTSASCKIERIRFNKKPQKAENYRELLIKLAFNQRFWE